MCPMHSEARQTDKLEFGAEKGLLIEKGAEKMGDKGLSQIHLTSWPGHNVFKDNIWDEGCRGLDFLLIG